MSDTYRVGHACPANSREATGVSVHSDTAAILVAADTVICIFVTLRPDAALLCLLRDIALQTAMPFPVIPSRFASCLV